MLLLTPKGQLWISMIHRFTEEWRSFYFCLDLLTRVIFAWLILISGFSFLSQHMRSPSVSCLDVDTTPPSSDSTPATLTPSTPTKSHRRSASCGNNPPNNIPGSGPDMRIIRIRMDLQDGNLYRSILVWTQNNLKSNFRRQGDYTKRSDWNYLRHAALTAFSSYLRKKIP